MKKILLFSIFILLFITEVLAQGGGGGGSATLIEMATVKDWKTVLDTLFFSRVQVNTTKAPATLSESLKRAWVYGVADWGNDSAYYKEGIQYWEVRQDLIELFFIDLQPIGENVWRDPWPDVKYRLLNFGINIDSLEGAAQGSNYLYYVGLNDNMSKSALAGFAKLASKVPIITADPVEYTLADTMAVHLKVFGNNLPIAGFRTIVRSGVCNFGTIVSVESPFSILWSREDVMVNYWYTKYAIVGMLGAPNCIGNADFVLGTINMIPWYTGDRPLYQERAYFVDTSGSRDYPVWGMKIPTRIFERNDMNQDWKTTVSDAVMASRYFLRGIPPALPHLGDANYNGRFDADDPYCIFSNSMWGGGNSKGSSGLGKTAGKEDTVASGMISVSVSSSADGLAKAVISFSGNVGKAIRFAASLALDGVIQDISYGQDVYNGITGTFQDGNKLNLLVYPKDMKEGSIVTVVFRADQVRKITLVPLGKDFLMLGENINVVINKVTGVFEDISIPDKFALLQNYPNPFNPTTNIAFALPQTGKVTLKVYDLLGREVASLADGIMNAGNHEATFNAPGLSSGTYIYRMTAGEFIETKRMILLR